MPAWLPAGPLRLQTWLQHIMGAAPPGSSPGGLYISPSPPPMLVIHSSLLENIQRITRMKALSYYDRWKVWHPGQLDRHPHQRVLHVDISNSLVYTHHGIAGTPKHLPSCHDNDFIQCNPEFCTVPISMRLAGYPSVPTKKQKLNTTDSCV